MPIMSAFHIGHKGTVESTYAKHGDYFIRRLSAICWMVTRIKASNYRRQIPVSPEPGRAAAAIFILFWVNIPWTSAGSWPCNGHPWIMKLRITKFLHPTRFISYLLEWCLNCVCYELFLGLILRKSLWFLCKWGWM